MKKPLAKKLKKKIAIFHPPYTANCTSADIKLHIYRKLQKKYNHELTVFIDKDYEDKKYLNKLDWSGLKIVFISSFDIRLKIIKPLCVFMKILGIPHMYYPHLEGHLKDFDVIISNDPELHIYAMQSYLIAKKHNIKLLYDSATSNYPPLFHLTKYLIKPLLKRIAKYASRFLVTYESCTNVYKDLKMYRQVKNKVVVVGLGLNTKKFYPIKLKKYLKFTILSVGTLTRVKGHQKIIKALHKLIENGHTDLKLKIIGTGPYEKQLKKLIKKNDLGDYVELLGYVGNENLNDIYNRSHLLFFGNKQEVTAVIAEAIMANLPFITTCKNGLDLYLPKEFWKFFVCRDTVKEIARKIIILKKKPVDDKIQKKLCNKIKKELNVEAITARYHAAIEG